MNQEDINRSSRPWWQGWFHDWNLSASDTRNYMRASLWSGLFFVLLAAGIVVLEPEPGDFKTMLAWEWALALSPFIPGIAGAYAWARFLRQAEELYRRVIIEAAAISFSITLVLYLVLIVLGNIFGEASSELSALVFSVIIVSFWVSWRLRMRHYE